MKVQPLTPFCKFLAGIRPGARICVRADCGRFFDESRLGDDFESPMPDMDGCVHPGEDHLWIEDTFNPIWRAGSRMILDLVGLRDANTGEFLPLDSETVDSDELDEYGSVDREDNFHILVYEAVLVD